MRTVSAFSLWASFVSSSLAHTAFTTLYINGVSQGEGTCVRMHSDAKLATYPVAGLTSDDMACGIEGEKPVGFVCPAPAGAKLSFRFREFPDASQGGVIDYQHLGPCSIYIKQVSDMFNDAAAGPGWVKLWEMGHDDAADKWCTTKLIEDKGLLTIDLPASLPAGYYLVRPELLALHNAAQGDPQYYVGCAQIYVEGSTNGSMSVPQGYSVSIPGYIDGKEQGNTFDVWTPHFPYPIPGPEVYAFPEASSTPTLSAQQNTTQIQGLVPDNCLIKNHNWCGFEVPSYSDEAGCWAAGSQCYQQGQECWKSAEPVNSANCDIWDKKCAGIQAECQNGNFVGPPGAGSKLQDGQLAITYRN